MPTPTEKKLQEMIVSGKYSEEDRVKIAKYIANLRLPLFTLKAPSPKFPFKSNFTANGEYRLDTLGNSTIKEMDGEISFDAVYPLFEDGKNINGEAAVLARAAELGGVNNQEDGEIIIQSELLPADFNFWVPLVGTIYEHISSGLRFFPYLGRYDGEFIVALIRFDYGLDAAVRLFVPRKVLSA